MFSPVRKCFRLIDQWLFKLLVARFTRGHNAVPSLDATASAETVLLFKPDGIGDFILWSEVFKEFAVRYNKARITMVCCAPVGELVRAMFPDWQTIEITKRPRCNLEFVYNFFKGKMFSQFKDYDLLVDLRVHRGDWELLFIAMFKARCKIGFASAESHLEMYDHLIFTHLLAADLLLPSGARSTRCHELEIVQSFFFQFWAADRGACLPSLRPYFAAPSKESQTTCLAQNSQPLIVVHPGSGNASKNWPPINWLNLTKHLLKRDLGLRVAVVVGQADVRGVDLLRVLSNHQRIQWWYNLPLPELASRLADATLFIGHDTGISHLAAAVGTSSLVLFGPTDPAVWAPPHANAGTIRAPLGRLDELSVDEVVAAVAEIANLRFP